MSRGDVVALLVGASMIAFRRRMARFWLEWGNRAFGIRYADATRRLAPVGVALIGVVVMATGILAMAGGQ